jgi:hypothetical protein
MTVELCYLVSSLPCEPAWEPGPCLSVRSGACGTYKRIRKLMAPKETKTLVKKNMQSLHHSIKRWINPPCPYISLCLCSPISYPISKGKFAFSRLRAKVTRKPQQRPSSSHALFAFASSPKPLIHVQHTHIQEQHTHIQKGTFLS